MNPIPNEKPLAIIGSIHAENGKIFHVHRSSINKARTLMPSRKLCKEELRKEVAESR